MGYCYGRTESGRMALSCDSCGQVGGVRKRTCPYKVLFSSLYSADGLRHTVPYCPAPALCTACFKNEGGSKGVHGAPCCEGATNSTAKYDIEQAKLESGEFHVTSAFGSWHENVPEGYVGVTFKNLQGAQTHVLIESDVYEPGAKPWLSDYPDIRSWVGPSVRKAS